MKPSNLRKRAKSYERKHFRKNVIKFIRNIRKIMKEDANSGKFRTEFEVHESQRHSWEVMVGLRWFRKHGGFEVEWNEEFDVCRKGRKYIDKIWGSIKWD
jgi:hypothetical protein